MPTGKRKQCHQAPRGPEKINLNKNREESLKPKAGEREP